jgi:DNA-binding transcriptional LysR family regulator
MSQSADPLPFELRSLEVFLCVCDCGTMSGAARVLGLTQSAVSQTIAELEQRVHADLFDRNVRPLGLTVSGVLLRQRASALVADARQIAPLLRDVRRNKLPLIRVGLVDSFSRLLVPDLPNHLSRFADHVSFVSGLTSSHVDDLLGRKLDILLGVDEFEALDGLESWPLLEEPYVIIAPRDAPAPTTVGDLRELGRKLKFVRYHPRRKIGVSIERHLRRLGVELRRAYEYDTPFAVSATVAKGESWAITTPLCIFESGELVRNFVCLPLPGPGFKRWLSLISRVRELARVPRETADFAIGRLNSELAPAIAEFAPWASAAIAVGDQIRRSP